MKKKVLVILNRLVIGGQALDTVPLLYHLQGGFDILILYGCKEKDEEEATFLLETFNNLPLKPITSFKRSFNPYFDITTFFSIVRTMRRFKPDVVHTHGLKSGLLGRIAAHISGVPCIIHTFHGHHFHSYFNKFISYCLIFSERILAKITTKIIAISNGQAEELATKYKIAPRKKIAVIPLGIDEKLFTADGANKRHLFRDKYHIAPQDVAVGIIGRIVPIKNYSLFVKIVAGILLKIPHNVKFFVIGDGADKVIVQEEFNKLGIGWHDDGDFESPAPVIFTSWLPEVARALHGMDIIMLTSHNEGTPMSLIEAQFCNKPVVATDVGGVRDTFLDGETGFLVPRGNVEAFIAKLATLINNEGLRKIMGDKAAIFASQNFSKLNEINSFSMLYQTCIK